MNIVGDDPEGQIDPEDYAEDGDLEVDEAIRLPANSPYRRVPSMARQESIHRTEYELDGLNEDFPDLFQFRDPLSDNDW